MQYALRFAVVGLQHISPLLVSFVVCLNMAEQVEVNLFGFKIKLLPVPDKIGQAVGGLVRC